MHASQSVRPAIRWLAIAVFSVGGCGGRIMPLENCKNGSVSVTGCVGSGAPAETAGAGTCHPEEYPSGPYGTVAGQIIDNLELIGRRDDNANNNVVDDPVRPIKLSDYFQDKKLKVLGLVTAAEWCQPCRDEQPELIRIYGEDHPRGAALLEAVIQDRKANPADMVTVDRWASTNWGNRGPLPFDVAADPTVVLGPYYNIEAFPMQMVIRTADMSIVWQANGDVRGFENQLLAVLGE